MTKWKEGDRARVVTRPVTEEDRKKNRYFEHMAGLVGTVQNVYEHEVSVVVDPASLSQVTGKIHETATARMREKFVGSISEEQKKQLTKEELEFTPHYVVLVSPHDLEKE